jgi:hypothetical protein
MPEGNKNETVKITEALTNNNMVPQESKVGKKLSDLTTRRVIVLVLAMLLSVPIFSNSTYLEDNTSYDIGLRMMSIYDVGTDEFNQAFKSYIEN